jgi:hypothetical protein
LLEILGPRLGFVGLGRNKRLLGGGEFCAGPGFLPFQLA